MRKGLDYFRGRQVFLAQFVDSLEARIDDRNVSIAPDHVVVRINHNLPSEFSHGHVINHFKRHGYDDEVARGGSFCCRCRASRWAKLFDQITQSFWAA
ncbi:hypothetical protein D3C85_1477150 [compost metagenome]